MKHADTLLTPSVFYILLSLSIKERHGYEIMKYVEHDSGGKVRLGPGTLYGAIKRLLEMGYIKESGERPDPKHDDERRRYYKITGKGLKILTSELKRYEEALDLARKNNVFTPKPVFIGI